MSLINQVLKDLEQRHASEMAEATHNLDGLALASPIRHKSAKSKLWLLSLIGLCIVAGVASAWWWQRANPTPGLQAAVASAQTATSAQPSQSLLVAQPPSSPPSGKPVPVQAMPIAQPVSVEPRTPVPAHHAKTATPKVTKVAHAPAAKLEAAGDMEKQRVPLRQDQKAELAYQTGYDQLTLHNVRRAELELRQALTLQPAHVRARELLAGILIKQGRWIETADVMQQGVQLLPGNLVFVKLYARTLMQLNRDRQAIQLLREHAPAVAQDPQYYALLAALYQRQQDHLAAANTYSQILKLQPSAGIWWVGLGISLEALGKQPEAQQAYARARKTGSLRGDLARYTDNRLLALDAIKYPIE